MAKLLSGTSLTSIWCTPALLLQALCPYSDAYAVAQHVFLLGTTVYLATIDVCLKASAGSAIPTSQRLFREKTLQGAMIDEFQRLPEVTVNAVL